MYVSTCVSVCVSTDFQLSLLHVHPMLTLGDSVAVLLLVHAFNVVCVT